VSAQNVGLPAGTNPGADESQRFELVPQSLPRLTVQPIASQQEPKIEHR
jgi:hypothetical protein